MMASVTLLPSAYDTSKTAYSSVNGSYPLANGLNCNADSDTYAEVNLLTGSYTESYLSLMFDTSQIPADATIESISCRLKARISNSSPYVLTGTAQLYYGTNAMGSGVDLGTSAVAQTISEVGYWDRERLDTLRLLITCKRGVMGGSNSQTLRFYGAELVVNYTGGNTEPSEQLMLRQSGTWAAISKVYKKSGGQWVEQSDLAGLFDAQNNYVKG